MTDLLDPNFLALLGVAFSIGGYVIRNEYQHKEAKRYICLIMDHLGIEHKKKHG